MRFASPLIGILATACFLGAAVVRPLAPAGGMPLPPDAPAVRQGFNLLATVQQMGAGLTPVPVQFGPVQLDAVRRLVAHVSDKLAVSGDFAPRRMRLVIGRRLAAQAWLNMQVQLRDEGRGGPPQVALRVGALDVPQPLTHLLLHAGPKVAKRVLGQDVPGFDQILPRFAVDAAGAHADVRLSAGVIGLLPLVTGGGGLKVDRDAVWRAYATQLEDGFQHPHDDFAAIIRRAAARADAQGGLGPTFVGLAMAMVGSGVRRLAGEPGMGPPCRVDPITTRLAGREDWPKHWAMSAALAATMGPRVARSIDLWKELDDSLPGGSGFSWADMAADTGGRLAGTAARDAGSNARAIAALRRADDHALFPPALTALPDALTNPQYRQTYGGIEALASRRQEARIEAALTRSPAYHFLP